MRRKSAGCSVFQVLPLSLIASCTILIASVSATQQQAGLSGLLDPSTDLPPYTITTTECSSGNCETIADTCVEGVCETTTRSDDNGTGGAAATEASQSDAVVTTTCTDTVCSTAATLTTCSVTGRCQQQRFEGLPPDWDGREPLPGQISLASGVVSLSQWSGVVTAAIAAALLTVW